MKDDTNPPTTAASELVADQESSAQALGKFLLDEQGDWVQKPGVKSSEQGDIPEPDDKIFKNHLMLKSESVQQRMLKVSTAESPLLEAAQPLLRALSDMPEQIADLSYVEMLKTTLKSQINLFSIVCDEVNIPWKKMAIVRYCLCTALDEAAHTTAWGLESGWSQSNLLNHFEGDNDGGNKFFLLIGRLSMNPSEFADVLEVLLRILGLGFEGRYSIVEEGDRQLTKIRQRLLTLIQSTRETTLSLLSPHGLQPHGPVRRKKMIVPVRLTALCAGIVVAAAFIGCKYWLSMRADGLNNDIYLMQNIKVTSPQLKMRLRLAVLLRKEIHMGIAVATPDGLTVPVLRNPDQKSIKQIAIELGELSKKARDKKLSPKDLQGANFTITSLGSIGGTAFTPLVNWPQVAILGISPATMQPVWNGSGFDPKLMLPLSLSYDHRVINGADAARFTNKLTKLLSDIRNILL